MKIISDFQSGALEYIAGWMIFLTLLWENRTGLTLFW